jgi:hypothetical protein
MSIDVTCDWCGEPIETYWGEIRLGGRYLSGKKVEAPPLVYHTSFDYSDGPCESSCFGKALRLLSGDDFAHPDAGYAWRLVPESEGHNDVYSHSYRRPVLGVQPLADLELDDATYKAVTKRGIFTIEHAVDARRRGVLLLTPKRLAQLDAALVRRGLLGQPEVIS